MRKVLIWGRMVPQDSLGVAEILLKNKIASNTGNLLFSYGAARATMTEDTQLIPFYSEDVERLLSNPAALEGVESAIIPLANAFRPDFMPKLEQLTRFLRAAKFPCCILSVGMQARTEAELERGFPFDAKVRAFVSAALDKSARVGVRGEYTAQYLRRLGFGADSVRAIGCPAAFANGPVSRSVRALPAEKLARAAVSARPGLPAPTAEWIGRGVREIGDVQFIGQDLYELWAIYFGHRRSRHTREITPDFYPVSPRDAQWREGGLRAFLRATDWIARMQDYDLAFGSRIHGNMAAMLAGRPGIVFASDLRVRELAEFHGIPCVDSAEKADSFRELYARQDFGAFERMYAQRFENFVDFLNENGVPHIYDPDAPKEAPIDRAIAAAAPPPELYSGMPVPLSDRLRKLEMYRMQLRYKIQKRRLK